MNLTIAEMIVQNRERYRRRLEALRIRSPRHSFSCPMDEKDRDHADEPARTPPALLQPTAPPTVTDGPSPSQDLLCHELQAIRTLLERMAHDLNQTKTTLPNLCRQILQALKATDKVRPTYAPPPAASNPVTAPPPITASTPVMSPVPPQISQAPSKVKEKVQIGDIAGMIDHLQGYFK